MSTINTRTIGTHTVGTLALAIAFSTPALAQQQSDAQQITTTEQDLQVQIAAAQTAGKETAQRGAPIAKGVRSDGVKVEVLTPSEQLWKYFQAHVEDAPE